MSAFQVSTLSALMLGHYQGAMTVKDLLANGSLGVGTYEDLDGEAIIIDGKAYKGLAGGAVVEARPDEKVAFALVSSDLMAGSVFQASGIPDIATLESRMDDVRKIECKGDNYSCFVRVDGTFDSVLVRACAKQAKPYKPFPLVAKSQVEKQVERIEGTIVGFWVSPYLTHSYFGWHLHFISRDRKTLGGHVLACSLKVGLIGVKRITDFRSILPTDEAFAKLDLGRDMAKELAAVEKNHK